MNLLKAIIDIGTSKQHNFEVKRHMRFANASALIICFFIIQNIALAVYYQLVFITLIQVVHFIFIASVLYFNNKGKTILASAWFIGTAIVFVTIYAILFTPERFNFVFLGMIIYMTFFIFSPSEKKYIITFVTITVLCYACVFVVTSMRDSPLVMIPEGFLNAQRWNTVVGIPMLSVALGAYAYFTIKKAEEEAIREREDLKVAQSQLIQSEKMASLGELTAGIAHEIQNPLNFVNNFSDVNVELLAEMKDELSKGNINEAKALSDDAIENQQKILHHGKRADAIVKGMLQHSRSSSGVKEPTDVNALADEYLRLAYHGLRAKDKSLNAIMNTKFDESIGKINVVPQDIGRVVLNLITNAFYAVTERKKQESENFEPRVSVSTKKEGGKVLISVKDNGNGIPNHIKEKIFQPFFTTKPTGQGTGLGLSMSYDIVRAHGGELKVETKEGEGTVFVILLPLI